MNVAESVVTRRELAMMLGVKTHAIYKMVREKRIPEGRQIRRGRSRREIVVWTLAEAHEACVRVAALPEKTRTLLDAGRAAAHHKKRESRDIGWLARLVAMHLGVEVLADILSPLHRGPLTDLPRRQAFLVRASLRSALAQRGLTEETR